jgi:hypothetical protein
MAATTETTKSTKNNDKPAKAAAEGETNTTAAAAPAAGGPPAGYLSAASDAVGFYDGDFRTDGNDKGKGNGVPIHFVPMHVILADSNIDKSKPSALLFGRLIDPCGAIRDGQGEGAVGERPMIETKRGDVVGIWFSAGMRDLASLMGAKVYMYQQDNGSWKPIKGKPSKMKTYFIANSPDRKGEKLTVREDRRNESAGVNAPPFAGKKLAGSAGVDSGDAGDDDIPF